MVSLIGQSFAVGGQGGLPQRAADTTLSEAAIPSVPQIATGRGPVISSPDTQVTEDLQQRRAEAYKQAVANILPKFFYPVSNVKFTIYKDSAGQYITQFTNIVSGETTQVPEPELIQRISDIGGGSNFVSTSA